IVPRRERETKRSLLSIACLGSVSETNCQAQFRCSDDESLVIRKSSFEIYHMLDDTIAAIATPLGEGGLAVIRLSGPEALAVADKSFVPAGKHSLRPSAAQTHTIHYGKIERAGRT